jgi:Na+/H+-translocating membrane pyrophosphatase
MNESSAILIGAVIGACAGFIGGAIAALAAVRSSQLAARLPLAAKIHELNRTFVVLTAASGLVRSGLRLPAISFAQPITYTRLGGQQSRSGGIVL